MPLRPVLKLCRTDEPMIGKRPIVVPGPWARVLQIRTWRGRCWKTPVPSALPTCGVVVARGRLRAPAGNHPERVGDPVVGCWPMGGGSRAREEKTWNRWACGAGQQPGGQGLINGTGHARNGRALISKRTAHDRRRLVNNKGSPSCGSGRGTAGPGIPSPGTKHCCQNSADMAAVIGPCRLLLHDRHTASVVAAAIQSTHPPPGRTGERKMHAPGQATGFCCAGSSGRVSLQLAMCAHRVIF